MTELLDRMFDPLAWPILLPLFWASGAFLLGPGRGAKLAIAGVALQLACALLLADQLLDHGPRVHAVGGWGAPLGIDLAADGLTAVMLLLTQAVALPLLLFARGYFADDAATARYFWPLTGFLLAGLNALFLAADLFNLYVTLELVGLAAVGLVAAGGGAAQIAAGLRYLFATLLGSGLYLLGVALIYGAYGSVSIATLTPLIDAGAPAAVWIAGGSMLLGLMLKTALFPFHYWLPPAHGGAPAPVSALLSALVVKASFYLILRLWLGPFAPLTGAIAWLPALLGSAAILWGSWQAICAVRLKMLVAYSTIAQLGYLFLIFPLLGPDGLAFQAGGMQVVAHGLAKAAMFAAAGVLIHVTGRDAVADVAGVASRLPVTLFAFALAGITLMGLPPSGGFLAKWLLIDAALKQGQWWLVAVIIAGGLLAAVYVFRVLRQAFLAPPPGERRHAAHRAPPLLEWTAFALAAASVLLGLRGVDLLRLLAVGGGA
ncbi:MAG: proton-conducting transporter membrane subunit [Rhodocyclaceae bacterium]|nr:proton-conducting transporter membrane subunit [Rhodocyclaceae bacterium]